MTEIKTPPTKINILEHARKENKSDFAANSKLHASN